MKYEVSGIIRGKTGFSIEVEAANERVAGEIAISALGSSQKLKKSMIKINSVKEVK